MKISDNVISFLENQGCVVVSTVDKDGFPHSACKGIVKIEKGGKVYLLDLYRGRTFENLKRNPHVSITAYDEHKFVGFCLKGRVKIIPGEKLESKLIKAWDEKITGRLAHRLLKNIREEKKHPWYPEIRMPKPVYMVVMEVEEIVDLTPYNLK